MCNYSLILLCLLTGEFGIVYKAQLSVTGIHPVQKIVAVKTLKGQLEHFYAHVCPY